MAQFVRQEEIGKLLKLPPSTVKLWLGYYAAFISPVQVEDQTVYTEEVLNLFLRIKALRAERYHLSTITRFLVEEGFPLYIVKQDLSHNGMPNKEMQKPLGQEPPSSEKKADPPIQKNSATIGKNQVAMEKNPEPIEKKPEWEVREVVERISAELMRISNQLNELIGK